MRIFISGVSGQFKICRDQVASDLRAVGAEVAVQEDFQQHGRALRETRGFFERMFGTSELAKKD